MRTKSLSQWLERPIPDGDDGTANNAQELTSPVLQSLDRKPLAAWLEATPSRGSAQRDFMSIPLEDFHRFIQLKSVQDGNCLTPNDRRKILAVIRRYSDNHSTVGAVVMRLNSHLVECRNLNTLYNNSSTAVETRVALDLFWLIIVPFTALFRDRDAMLYERPGSPQKK